MNLDSLPDRPLTGPEFDALEDADSIDGAHQFVEHGGPDGRRILQFLLDLDGEYVALDFDTDASQWTVAGRSDDFTDASAALSNARLI